MKYCANNIFYRRSEYERKMVINCSNFANGFEQNPKLKIKKMRGGVKSYAYTRGEKPSAGNFWTSRD